MTTWKTHIAIFISYFLLALLLTWPTITHFTTHLPGDGGDDPAIAWNLWWLKYSLLNEGQNPFFSKHMFYPLGINLAFYTLTPLNGFLSLSLLLNFGVVTASNLHLWFSFAVGGYGAFLLLRYLNISSSPLLTFQAWLDLPAWLGGLMYTFASNKLFYVALGQFNIASTHWIPFCILFFIKMHQATCLKNDLIRKGVIEEKEERDTDRNPTHSNLLPLYSSPPLYWLWSSLTALFLILQAWSEMTYASFLIIFMALYWLYWLIADTQRQVIQWLFIKATLLLVLLFGLGISPILAAMLPDMLTEGDFFGGESGFAEAFSADLKGYLLPTMHHPLFGHLVTQSTIHHNIGQHIYVGYLLLFLSLLGLSTHWRNRLTQFWIFASLSFALLTLGPSITVNGTNTGLTGPFWILQQLSFFNGNRYPSRFSVLLILSLTPLASLGLGYLLKQIHKIRTHFQKIIVPPTLQRGESNISPIGRLEGSLSLLLALLFASGFIFEHLSTPLPQSDMRVPKPYHPIAQDSNRFAVLDIPFAWRNGFRITGAYTTGFMFGQFYQTLHQKPMLQGNTSRNTDLSFQYFTEAPIISSLRVLQAGYPLREVNWWRDHDLAADVLRFFSIKYIIVRPEAPSYLNHPQATISYIETLLSVEKLHQDPSLILYQVKLPSWPTQIDLFASETLAPLYFAEGWGIRPTKNTEMIRFNENFRGGTPTIVAHRKQVRLLVPLNGEAQTFQAKLRFPSQDHDETNQVWLKLNGWHSGPMTFSNTSDLITLTIPADVVQEGINDITLQFAQILSVNASDLIGPTLPDLTLISAGEEAGNLGYIYLNGIDVSPNQVGYNLALVTAEGRLLKTGAFNTYATVEANQALAEFITQAPDDALIAVVAKDEASNHLTEEAVQALQAIGSRVDLRGQFRASHAFIGSKVKGGLAEQMDSHHPVKITTAFGLVEPNVATVFEAIRFEAHRD